MGAILNKIRNKKKKLKNPSLFFSFLKKGGLKKIFLFSVLFAFFFSFFSPIFLSPAKAEESSIRPVFKNNFQSIDYEGVTFDFIGYGNSRTGLNSSGFFKSDMSPGRAPTRDDLSGPTAEDADLRSVSTFAIFVSRSFRNTFCPITKDLSVGRFIRIPDNDYTSAKENSSEAIHAYLHAVYWEENLISDGCHGEEGYIKKIPSILPPQGAGAALEWAGPCEEGKILEDFRGLRIINKLNPRDYFEYEITLNFSPIFSNANNDQIRITGPPLPKVECSSLPEKGIITPQGQEIEIINPWKPIPTSATITGIIYLPKDDQDNNRTFLGNIPITITSTDKSVEKTVSSNADGRYSIALPCNLSYKLTVDHPVDGAIGAFLKELSELYATVTINDKITGSSQVTINEKCEAQPSKYVDIILSIKTVGPIERAMTGAIALGMEFVNLALQITGNIVNDLLIRGNEIENTKGVDTIWTDTRNVALSLLTLVLLLVAFANILSINLEQFGLAKMIPKIIITIVLTYFSLIIASTLLDLASGLQSLLVTEMGGPPNISGEAAGELKTGAADLASGFAEAIFIFLLGFFIFLAMVWLVVVLVVRNAMLLFLVAVSPIAFLCNILPFTEKYYKQWWASFWKWMFIGPAVLFMLWLADVFLGAYKEAKFLGEPGAQAATLEGWLWLITATVMIALAALLPLKMGGEIYGQIQKVGNRVPGVKGIKDTYGAFKKGRGEYKALKTQQRAENIRAKIGRVPYLGGIAAGTRGVFSQDFDIAKKVYAAEHKEDTQQEAEEALNKEISRGASLESPRVVALLEKIAGEFHSSSLGADTQKILTSAVAEGLNKDENGAPNKPILLGVTRKLEQNPNKDAAVGLYAKAIEKGYLGEITYANNLRDLAVRKASNKTVPQSGRDDLIVIKTSANAGHTDAINAWQQIQSYAADSNTNREDYVRNTPAKTKAEHESIGFKLGSPNVVLGNNQQQNAPRPNPKPNGPSGNVPRNR